MCQKHTIIYKDNGDVLIFGYNDHGQLGLGHNKNINVPTLLMNNPYVSSVSIVSSVTLGNLG